MYNTVFNQDFYEIELNFLKENKFFKSIDLILTLAPYNEDFNSNYNTFFDQCNSMLSEDGHLILLTNLNNEWRADTDIMQINTMVLSGILYYARKHRFCLNTIGLDSIGNIESDHYIFYFSREHYIPKSIPRRIWDSNDPATNRDEGAKLPFRWSFLSYICDNFSKENDWICDPFAGWDTVGIWCERNKRNYVGFERSEEEFQKIFDRRNDVIKMLDES